MQLFHRIHSNHHVDDLKYLNNKKMMNKTNTTATKPVEETPTTTSGSSSSWLTKKRRLLSNVVREHFTNKKNRNYQDDSDTTVSGCNCTNGADEAPWRVGNVLPHGAPTESDWWKEDRAKKQEDTSTTTASSQKEITTTAITKSCNSSPSSSKEHSEFHNCGFKAWLRCRAAWRSAPQIAEELDGNDHDSYDHNDGSAVPVVESSSGLSVEVTTTSTATTTTTATIKASKTTTTTKSSSMRAVLSRKRCLKRKLVKALNDGSRKCQLPQRVNLTDAIDAYKTIWDVDDAEDMYPE